MSLENKKRFASEYKSRFRQLRQDLLESKNLTQTDMNFYFNCELDNTIRQINSDVLHELLTEKEGESLKTELSNYTTQFCK